MLENDIQEKYYIYCITNTINNKKYIGRTKDYEKRIKAHKINGRAKKGESLKHPLYKDMKKHSLKYFTFEQIEINNNLFDNIQREKYYINKLNTYNSDFGYNQTNFHYNECKLDIIKVKTIILYILNKNTNYNFEIVMNLFFHALFGYSSKNLYNILVRDIMVKFKDRKWVMTEEVYKILVKYCKENKLEKNDNIFNIEIEDMNNYLELICYNLDLETVRIQDFYYFYDLNIKYNRKIIEDSISELTEEMEKKYGKRKITL